MRMLGKLRHPPGCIRANRGCTCYIPRTQWGLKGRQLAKRIAKAKEKESLRKELLDVKRRSSPDRIAIRRLFDINGL